MCESPATSREDVPPYSLFPKAKDLPGEKDYRKNPIKVPSCDLHNNAKSKDDEYFKFLLTSTHGGNSVQRSVFSTSVTRAIRNPKGMRAYERFVQNNPKHFMLDTGEEKFQTGGFQSDVECFNRVIHHISCGLLFHRLKIRWSGNIALVTNNLFHYFNSEGLAGAVEEQNQLKCKRFSELFSECEFHGEHPDVFTYAIKEIDALKYYFVHMVFYGGIQVTSEMIGKQYKYQSDLQV